MVFFERFAQITYRATLNDLMLQSFVWKGRNKYHGHTMAIGNQTVLQFDSTQAGHLDIGDEARRGHRLCRSEEFLSGAKCQGIIAQ